MGVRRGFHFKVAAARSQWIDHRHLLVSRATFWIRTELRQMGGMAETVTRIHLTKTTRIHVSENRSRQRTTVNRN